MDRNYDVIKIATMFIKTTLKDSNKARRIKMQSISVFLDITKLLVSGEKNADVSRTPGMYHVTFSESSLGKV